MQPSMLLGINQVLKCGARSMNAELKRNITLSAAYLRKTDVPKLERTDSASGALAILKKHSTVRLRTEGLPKIFREAFPSSSNELMHAEADSNKLKLLVLQTGFNLLLVRSLIIILLCYFFRSYICYMY